MTARIATIALVVLAIAAPVFAQTDERTGGVRGLVKDSGGLTVPGATVSILNPASGAARSATTDEGGTFTFAGLVPGAYRVRAELGGFSPVERDAVQVTAGAVTEIAIELPVLPYGETVVVTGSRKEEMVRYSPAAISVLGSDDIQSRPAQNYGDVLRSVPGVNVTQFSARDVQFTARGAASQASNKTLALVDGRAAYQPYYGMIIWDLLGVDFDEIKQVEVMRGPGSALWGTNALTGVVNIITRDPGEDLGTHVRVGGGTLNTGDVAVRHAGMRGRVGYKFSASFFTQDAWDRPEALPDGTPLPPYDNQGTTRASASARFDFKQDADTTWRADAGYATTGGGIVTVVGPQDARPMRQGFGRLQYQRGQTRIGASFDAHDARVASLLSPSVVTFSYQTVQVEAEQRVVLPRQVITIAGSGRFNHFDINVAPDENTRQELGLVADTEIFVNDAVRLRAGGRLDWFSSFGTTVSPRVGVVVEPVKGHTFRGGYNRAYVAPSFLENFLSFQTDTIVGLPTGPYSLPFLAVGNRDLDPLTNQAIEAGYTGVIGRRATVSMSVYRNESKGIISLVPTEFYTPATPPPGWPLPVEVLAGIPLPKVLTELNLGKVIDVGVETSFDARVSAGLSMYVNHSFQKTPDVSKDTPIQLNVPARHRVNAGVNASHGRFFGSLSVSTSTRAFWADVQPYTGYTKGYTLANGTVGARLTMGRGEGSLALKVINIGDDKIRQHIFGDLLRRRASLELRVSF